MNLTGFRINRMPYTRMRAIMAEKEESEPILRQALAQHGIPPDDIRADTEIFYVVSQEQLEFLKSVGVANPTFLQLIGSSQAFSLTAEGCEARYRALKEEE